MNIFFLTETKSGCYKWRSEIPAKYLRRRGHTVQIFSDDVTAYEAPDVLVIFRTHYPKVEKLVAWCKGRGIRVVFDTDDAFDQISKENLYYEGIQQRMNLYDFLLEEADLVTTTTDVLAGHLLEWNPNVAVLPSSVDPEEWTVQPRRERPRIGWTGSVTHFNDLLVALDALRDLQKKHDFDLVLQGLCEDESVQAFHDRLQKKFGKAFRATPFGRSVQHLLERLSQVRHEFHPLADVTRHSQLLCEMAFDIGLAPVIDDSFNRNKSCIKYYEYAMSGAVTVASHALPYSLEVPITARNRKESWRETLEEVLMADRERLWASQRDWVLSYRNMQKNAELWERAYLGDLAGEPGGVFEESECSPAVAV